MGQPYCTTAQVINKPLVSLIASAKWNATEPGQVVIQDLTHVALAFNQIPVTVTYLPGGTAGSEVVTVTGTAITIKIQSGVSTATQVLAAINASAAALALISSSITGTAGTAQVLTASPVVIAGDVAQLIAEGDREIDNRLAGLEIALPFASNPPVIQDLSKLYARFACFRDLYAAGKPSDGVSPQAQYYLDEFEKKWMNFEEGWAKLVDANGAQIAMTKFATVTIDEKVCSGSRDEYPNFPSGPYADPPGIEY